MPEGVTDPNYKPLPGRLGNLTPGQQHTLETFRKQIQEEGWFVPERMDDATLLRCVRPTVEGPRARRTLRRVRPALPSCDRPLTPRPAPPPGSFVHANSTC